MKLVWKKFLGILLCLVLAVGLLQGMSLAAWAASYASDLNFSVLQYGDTIDASSADIRITNDFGFEVYALIFNVIPDNGGPYTIVDDGHSFTLPAGYRYTVIEVQNDSPTVDRCFVTFSPNVKVDPPAASAVYGQTLADVALTNPAGNTAGTWEWEDDLSTSVGSVGDHIFKAMFTPADTTNFNSVRDIDVVVSVGKANSAVASIPAAKDLTYSGSAQELVTPGTGIGGTMKYALGNAFVSLAPYTTAIPTAAEPGLYYVWFKVIGDENHYNSPAKCAMAIIRGSVSALVTFAVENGSWDDGTTDPKIVLLSGVEENALKLSADQIPAVGSRPDENYQAGSWDVVPDTANVIAADTIYTYTYERADEETVSGTDGTDDTDEVLQSGSVGAAVLTLQRLLASLGYFNGDLDGIFGAATEAAVRAFQTANDLYADTIVGPRTWEALRYVPSETDPLEPEQQGVPVSETYLSFGSTGEAVVSLQQALASLGYFYGTADGVFGCVTDAAVRAFQYDSGLYPDGIVGPRTREALREPSSGIITPEPLQKGACIYRMDLAIGSMGEEVEALQRALTILGYFYGEIDGYFGPVTGEAVMALQSDFGLNPDGVVGAATRAILGL